MNPIEKARNQLYELQKLPDNKLCMDCGARDPRWASMNLGIFICIKCAGAHRTLGTHISLVKSLDQDNWTLEQVENLRKKGNANAKKYFEATLKPNDTWENGTKRVVSDTIALENFVRRKYEYLEFAPKKETTGLSNSGNTRPARSATATASAPASSPSFVLPSYESTRRSKDDSGLIHFDNGQADYLTNDFKPRGEPVAKSDIMQLYDTPKLQPTPSPATKNVAPPTPTYPAANYNVNLHAPAYPNPYAAYNPAGLSPNPSPSFPYGSPVAPISPYGNPNLPSYANTIPPPAYGTPYSTPPMALPRIVGPDPTPPLPHRPSPFTSLTSSLGAPLTPTHSAPMYNASPLASPPNPFAPYGSPQTPPSYHNSPSYNQNPRANYGTPMPAAYAQPPNPFTNNMTNDPNYIASQFNFR